MKRVWERFRVLPNQKNTDVTIPIVSEGNCLYLNGLCNIETKIPILEEGITIGRQMLKQNYNLTNGRIGKSHARIYLMGDDAYITDLGSRNGTYLNGERLKKQKAERIERGDIVSFSDEEFILC
jgi:pSer/pThr/pTyr-binding forkhead associated (FHA) protein